MCERNPFGLYDYGEGSIRPGGYSTHVVVDRMESMVKIPNNIPGHIACTLPCAGLTTYSALMKAKPAILEAIKVRNKANIFVIGVGGLGLWCTMLAKHIFEHVSVVVGDISEDKLDIARECGIDGAILLKKKYDSREEIMNEIQRITNNNTNAFDAVLDFVGSSDSVFIGHKMLGIRGCLVVSGLHQGQLEMQMVDLIRKELHVMGNRVGSPQEFRDLVELLSTKNVKYPAIQRVRLQDINEVHNALRVGKITGRAVIDYVTYDKNV